MKEEHEDERSLQSLFFWVNHKYAMKLFKQLSMVGVYPGQVPILVTVKKRPGITQKEISDTLEIKPPTVNVSIKRMEAAGLIRREARETNARSYGVYLTEKGIQANQVIKDILEENESIIFQSFSQSEICLFRRLLMQMGENIEKNQTSIGKE